MWSQVKQKNHLAFYIINVCRNWASSKIFVKLKQVQFYPFLGVLWLVCIAICRDHQPEDPLLHHPCHKKYMVFNNSIFMMVITALMRNQVYYLSSSWKDPMGALLLQNTNVSSCGSGTLQSQKQQVSRKGHFVSSARRIKNGNSNNMPPLFNIIFQMPLHQVHQIPQCLNVNLTLLIHYWQIRIIISSDNNSYLALLFG